MDKEGYPGFAPKKKKNKKKKKDILGIKIWVGLYFPLMRHILDFNKKKGIY